MTITGQAATVTAATPEAVFHTLTDIAGLPSWNQAMTAVIVQPSGLEVGMEWVVEFHALGNTWRSRSTVEQLDVEGRRVLLGRIRARQLARTEIPASLNALATAAVMS